jgi:hypothetical protein
MLRTTEQHRASNPNLHAFVSSLPKVSNNERWCIADSGASHHYHPDNDFMVNPTDVSLEIEGLGGNGPQTRSFGTLACSVQARQGPGQPHHPLNYTGIMFSVHNARVPLWSEVQLATEGHRIYRDGHPENGRHGVGFKRDDSDDEPFAFAPYHFDRESMLWWIKITKATPQHVKHANNFIVQDHPFVQIEKQSGPLPKYYTDRS